MRAPLLCLPFAFALLACSGAPPPETIDATETPTEPGEMAPEVARPVLLPQAEHEGRSSGRGEQHEL